jgi:hypothetical protein
VLVVKEGMATEISVAEEVAVDSPQAEVKYSSVPPASEATVAVLVIAELVFVMGVGE